MAGINDIRSNQAVQAGAAFPLLLVGMGAANPVLWVPSLAGALYLAGDGALDSLTDGRYSTRRLLGQSPVGWLRNKLGEPPESGVRVGGR